jgi:two-component system sensor histidine kinase KdpD
LPRLVRTRTGYRSWLAAALAVGAATLLNLALSPAAGYMAAAVPYLAAICLLGLAADRWPVLAAALASALLWNYLFIPPRFTFLVSRLEDIMMFCLYFFLAAITGWAGSRLRATARSLTAREEGLAALNAAASALAGARGTVQVAETGLGFIAACCSRPPCLILSPPGTADSVPAVFGPQPALDGADGDAARLCRESGQASGRFTSRVPQASRQFIPLCAGNRVLGILGLDFPDGEAPDPAQGDYLSTLCRTISIALEREILAEEMRQRQLSDESERLSAILLNSISHELRSPLTVIKGSASALADPETQNRPAIRDELIQAILQGTDRLNGIVENLLSMNRLEAGNLQLKLDDYDPLELIGAAREKCRDMVEDRQVQVIPDPDCPPVRCDEVLILQVLANLLDNAVRHGGPRVRIDISYHFRDGRVWFSVTDTGAGLARELQPRLFSKFFRGPGAGPGGTGIGLSICRGIVAAHCGRIQADSQEGQGFRVSFDLPAAPEAMP